MSGSRARAGLVGGSDVASSSSTSQDTPLQDTPSQNTPSQNTPLQGIPSHDTPTSADRPRRLLTAAPYEPIASPILAKPANPLTYPQSDKPFSQELFEKPTAEYRGCPLWAWNTKLDKAAMVRQIGYLQQMGFGGFHMHVRTGLDTEYLGEEFMDIVKTCVDVAEKKNMMACLYDDDRWPSGVAGGKVIEKNPKHKAQHLLFTKTPYGHGHVGGCSPSSAAACRSENGTLLAKYAITLNEDGTLRQSRILWVPGRTSIQPVDGEMVSYAYVETNPPSEWFNGHTYVNTMSEDATRDFIAITHEKYKSCVGDKFGTSVPCIFTDEPQFAMKTQLSNPFDEGDQFLPWTDDLLQTMRKRYYSVSGTTWLELLRCVPELFWNLHGEKSLFRYRFHDHVAELFVSSYMDVLGEWCTSNNILLNGHMMEEPTLESQTHSIGEAMRCYRSQTLPGMDLLSDMVEYNTAKQVVSVARQQGSKGAMSELYGCTHWHFTFEGHKGSGDWQAALGITFRVPHLSMASMAGEAKRDYPASLNYQIPWYREYRYIEDHFARVGVAMTRGRPITRVAVIHPIESFWLAYGPQDDRDGEMGNRDQWFRELTEWLLHGLIDFDFISETLLPDQHGGVQKGGRGEGSPNTRLLVGKCAYEAVILPNLLTIQSTTLDILNEFSKQDGKVIIAGDAPELRDAEHKIDPLAMDFHRVPWIPHKVLSTVDQYREIDIKKSGSEDRADTLLYQMRQDGDERFLFVCNTDRTNGVDTKITLRGWWKVMLLETLDGKSNFIDVGRERVKGFDGELGTYTTFSYRFEGCASILLNLAPSPSRITQRKDWWINGPQALDSTVPLTLQYVKMSEEGTKHSGLNVLMLDYARYFFQGENNDWSHVQEILALNNEILDRLSLPRKGMAWRQPWTLSPAERAPKARACFDLQFRSDFEVTAGAYLAMELPEGKTHVSLNGVVLVEKQLPTQPDGLAEETFKPSTEDGHWFVDESITMIPIPPGTIKPGNNILQIWCCVGILTPVERVYILGNFKVNCLHDVLPDDPVRAVITPPDYPDADTKTWGDIMAQGFPFYAGNITYVCTFTVAATSEATLCIPKFSSPVLTVGWGTGGKQRKGHIAFQPRRLKLGILAPGTHVLQITAYGNRYNAFGHIHAPDWMNNCWPDAWRTQSWAWTDNYNVKPSGILECPTVLLTGIGTRETTWGWLIHSPLVSLGRRAVATPSLHSGPIYSPVVGNSSGPLNHTSAETSSSWVQVANPTPARNGTSGNGTARWSSDSWASVSVLWEQHADKDTDNGLDKIDTSTAADIGH